MARNYARFNALVLLSAASLLAGCGAGSRGMINAAVPTTTASLSASSYDFGQNIVGNPDTQTVVEVTNTGTNPLNLNPTLLGSTGGFTVVAAQSCGTTLAPASSCPIVVTFSPAAAGPQTATLNLGLSSVSVPTAPGLVTLTGSAAVMTAGTVTATANPQVALYTITPPFAGNVTVNFGPTTSYGKQTWSVATPSGGGPVSIEVAGMLANTAYHLQAVFTLADGVTASDVDHPFTTGAVPLMGGPQFTGQKLPQLTATTPAGMTPQPGIEFITGVAGPAQGLYATDLNGNVIWTYPFKDQVLDSGINGAKTLPNGDIVLEFGAGPEAPLSGPIPSTLPIMVREIDLVGNTVRQISLAQVNAALAANGFSGLVLANFHHDLTPLPNGHLLVMANTLKSVVLTGQTTPTQVLGDVVVDLDPNWNPVWVWNEFDHLDVNRHPMNFPDWTHSNAIIYSSDDGNFIVSIRHQNWLVKVNYANGSGDGSILWKLGEDGDFTLMNNGAVDTNPADWFYAQHGPNFVGASNAGIFNLTLMDNGDDRIFPAGVTCGTGSAPPCLYSTVPIMEINESKMTATLTFHQIIPANMYNNFGGNSEVLENGNVEYDLCAIGLNSAVFEVTPNSQAQTVWELQSTATPLYRAFRLPSLYPGVQW
ncbi:MAG: aryl-sulfate sulfotransferase [Acidobacteriaceae bacterium]